MSGLCDSNELALLRQLVRQSGHRFAKAQLTPLKLGAYVGERGIRVRDLGGHSERWKRLFREGVEAGRRHKKVNP